MHGRTKWWLAGTIGNSLLFAIAIDTDGQAGKSLVMGNREIAYSSKSARSGKSHFNGPVRVLSKTVRYALDNSEVGSQALPADPDRERTRRSTRNGS